MAIDTKDDLESMKHAIDKAGKSLGYNEVVIAEVVSSLISLLSYQQDLGSMLS